MLPSLMLERRLSRIPPSAVQRLTALAERQSEGRIDRSVRPATYFGSTYFTFPLARVRSTFAGRMVRQMGTEELARTLEVHPLLRLRLMRLAREEAERRLAGRGAPRSRAGDDDPGCATRDVTPGTARVTSTISQDGRAVVIEVGLELPCAVEEHCARGAVARVTSREARP
jgi:hypothetical protein